MLEVSKRGRRKRGLESSSPICFGKLKSLAMVQDNREHMKTKKRRRRKTKKQRIKKRKLPPNPHRQMSRIMRAESRGSVHTPLHALRAVEKGPRKGPFLSQVSRPTRQIRRGDQKKSRTPNLSKICPQRLFLGVPVTGSNIGENLVKISLKITISQILTNLSQIFDPLTGTPKTSAGTNFGQIWGSGRF